MSQLNRTRINNVLNRMTEAGVEQMIVTSPVSIFYLTGAMVHPGERCLALYLTTDGNVTLVVNQLHNYIKLDGAKVVFFHDTEDPVAILAKEVKPGKLGEVIQIIGASGFNMESIKSRTMPHVPFEYYFYIELVGAHQPDRERLMQRMSSICETVRLLGTYTK